MTRTLPDDNSKAWTDFAAGISRTKLRDGLMTVTNDFFTLGGKDNLTACQSCANLDGDLKCPGPCRFEWEAEEGPEPAALTDDDCDPNETDPTRNTYCVNTMAVTFQILCGPVGQPTPQDIKAFLTCAPDVFPTANCPSATQLTAETDQTVLSTEPDVTEADIFLPLPPPPPAMPPCIDPEKMFSTKKKVAPGRNPTPDPRSGNSACWKLRGALGQFCGKTYHPQCPIGSPAGSCTAPTNPESADDAENYGDWVNYKCFVKKQEGGKVLACGKDKTETFSFCSTTDPGGTTSGGTTTSFETGSNQAINTGGDCAVDAGGAVGIAIGCLLGGFLLGVAVIQLYKKKTTPGPKVEMTTLAPSKP